MLKLENRKYYIRHPDWATVLGINTCDFVNGKMYCRVSGGDHDFISWFLALLVTPLSGSELRNALENSDPDRCLLAKRWIVHLLKSGVIYVGNEESAYRCLENFLSFGDPDLKKPCKHVVLGISGSSSSPVAIDYALTLLSDFTDSIDIIVTQSAAKFVNTYPLEIKGIRVWRSMYQLREGAPVPHMKLARDTDLVVVLPASAHTISRIATGSCSDLLSMVISCTRAPVVLFPSMNPRILESPPVKRNIAQVIQDGRYVVYPGPTVSTSDFQSDRPAISFGGVGVSSKQPENLSLVLSNILKGSKKSF